MNHEELFIIHKRLREFPELIGDQVMGKGRDSLEHLPRISRNEDPHVTFKKCCNKNTGSCKSYLPVDIERMYLTS